MEGDITLGAGDKVTGAEFPLAVLFYKGVKLPVYPDYLGLELAGYALNDDRVQKYLKSMRRWVQICNTDCYCLLTQVSCSYV